MSEASGIPQVILKFDPAGPRFAISEDATMPVITVTAELRNGAIDPRLPPPIYTWHAELTFNGTPCPHGARIRTTHSPMAPGTGPGNRFVIPFTQVRGGALQVNVSVVVGGRTLVAASSGLVIVGTNPSMARLAAVANPSPVFRKIMRHESRLQQFLPDPGHTDNSGYPKFSQDNMGGVGLCQITNPPPTPDEIWNWKANVATGWKLFEQKRQDARTYPAVVRQSPEFSQLVALYNEAFPVTRTGPQPLAPPACTPEHPSTHLPKVAASVNGVDAAPWRRAPITITVPEFTEEQLARDQVRCFNTHAGGLHEYRLRRDANGMLVVTESPDGLSGMAEWEQVSKEERLETYFHKRVSTNHWGDPDYVANVERQITF